MTRLAVLVFGMAAYLPSSHLQKSDSKTFISELFVNGNSADSGLYEGEVKGRPRFEETQVPHGIGTMYYFINDRLNRHNYTGDWVNGLRDGSGTTSFKDGAIYTGHYKKSLEDGSGSVSYPNGNQLDAEFVDGKIEGHGVFRYVNGDQREGFFSDNVLEGQVIFTRKDGVTVIETWVKGNRLASEDQIVSNAQLTDLPSKKTTPNSDETNSNNSRPKLAQNKGFNVAVLMKAFRSGDRFALFRDREPKKKEVQTFSVVSAKSRNEESEFLRKLFDNVNKR